MVTKEKKRINFKFVNNSFQHCKTLRQALHVWLDQYPEDFREPPNFPCLSQLEDFVQRTMPNSELDVKVKLSFDLHSKFHFFEMMHQENLISKSVANFVSG